MKRVCPVFNEEVCDPCNDGCWRTLRYLVNRQLAYQCVLANRARILCEEIREREARIQAYIYTRLCNPVFTEDEKVKAFKKAKDLLGLHLQGKL